MDAAQARRALAEAELLVDAERVDQAIDRLADDITRRLGDADPLVLCVLTGGIIPAGLLLPRLRFPLELDYLHASRYRGETAGGELRWIARPSIPLHGRSVLVVDDILDHGITLMHIIEECRQQGAREVLSAVLVEKELQRPADIQADFVGLKVPDRYVFGCGMDYRGYYRNLPAIYAVSGL